MRAVIYTRVSSDRNDTGKSVDEQEAECRAYCKRQGWTVVRVFSDNDRSASRHARKDRPEYVALRTFLADGGADVLAMWEGSRAQRDLRDYLRLRDLCADRGIGYSYSGRLYDLSRTDDRFATGLDALLAERESDLTRDRVLRSVRAGVAAGRPHGKLLYGYRREYDARGVFIAQLVHDGQAAVIRDAAARVEAGTTPNAIARDLNRRGVPTPYAETLLARAAVTGDEAERDELRSRAAAYQWDLTQVKRLVTNRAYVAQRTHRSEVAGPAIWPAILDERTHAACVRRLTDPRRRTAHDSAVKYLLTGVARCGVAGCGSRMGAQRNRTIYDYMCKAAWHVAIKVQWLDDFVEGLVVEWLSRPAAATLLNADDRAGDEALAARREAAEKRLRLDGFYAEAAAGRLSPQGLAAVETRLLAEIAAAEERVMAAGLPPVVRSLVGPDAAARWGGLLLPQRREVVATLLDVRVVPTGRGERRFRPERVKWVWLVKP